MLRVIFLGLISLFLLFLYAYATYFAVEVLKATNSPVPPTLPADNPLSLLSLVSGLVSALVISVLAITPPNDSPDKALVSSVQNISRAAVETDISNQARRITQVLTYTYLAVWFMGGVVAVYYAFLSDYPKPLPELSAAAKSWLGLAIASAYAFFGLKPG